MNRKVPGTLSCGLMCLATSVMTDSKRLIEQNAGAECPLPSSIGIITAAEKRTVDDKTIHYSPKPANHPECLMLPVQTR